MKHLDRRSFLQLTPAMVLAGTGAACGYSLAGRGSFLPGYIRILGIPLFTNRTPYPTIDTLFTEKVRVEFQSRGRYSVNPTEEGADGIVRGDIVGIGAQPVGYIPGQQLASRYRFNIALAVQFFDVRQKAVLWENPSLNFSDEYQLSQASDTGFVDPVGFLDRERAAMDRLSTDFARTVVTAILEAF
jgi:hypothetical protein